VDDLRLNANALAIADDVEERADELRIATTTLDGGARIIDLGIDVKGGYAAGKAMAEICMGGLGHISYETVRVGIDNYFGVSVWTDHPAVSCMASQYAGWAIQVDKFFAMGSGPLRAHARVEKDLYAKLKYSETAPDGVLVLETRAHPTDAVASWVAERAHLTPSQITFVVAPTASTAGSVQIVARVIETGLHKLDALGFDVTRVVHASGSAPIPPQSTSDLKAIGRTNDCILYGGEARLLVDATDEELEPLTAKLPASASPDYGKPFVEIFNRYKGDFYKIDPLLFSPAEVWLTSTKTGRTFHAGLLNPEVLRASLMEEETKA
jgi:methenyltetrahydromethanopterin cyclohydrolase